MDLDDGSVAHANTKSETLFAKSKELSVAFYANLPAEVKQVLKNAGKHWRTPLIFPQVNLFVMKIFMGTRIREPSTLLQGSHLLCLPKHVLFGNMPRY